MGKGRGRKRRVAANRKLPGDDTPSTEADPSPLTEDAVNVSPLRGRGLVAGRGGGRAGRGRKRKAATQQPSKPAMAGLDDSLENISEVGWGVGIGNLLYVKHDSNLCNFKLLASQWNMLSILLV